MSQSSIPSNESISAHVLFVREADGTYRVASSEEVVHEAKQFLARRVRRGAAMSSPEMVKDYLRLRMGPLEHEVFAVLFLDSQNRLIELKDLFRGTVTQTSVYPREIVKEALRLNAAGVILTHNHPSGLAEPSRADELLTQCLKTALALVDVKVLDHLVVAAGGAISFAERGLL